MLLSSHCEYICKGFILGLCYSRFYCLHFILFCLNWRDSRETSGLLYLNNWKKYSKFFFFLPSAALMHGRKTFILVNLAAVFWSVEGIKSWYEGPTLKRLGRLQGSNKATSGKTQMCFKQKDLFFFFLNILECQLQKKTQCSMLTS